MNCSPVRLTRVDAMIAEGVSTLEIKSGYGLDIEPN
jgi:imidazolonepropionase